jgi:hypothetical protein
MNEHKKRRLDPNPPLPPDYPDLHHPDLDSEATKEVGEPPNHDDVNPGLPNPEPPD